MAREYDHLFKVLIIGDGGVGKTDLLVRFGNDSATIGVDFRIQAIDVNGEKCKLQIWDTAGQEKFRTITTSYYRGAHGVIVVYDVCSGDTFASLSNWIHNINQSCDNIAKILVGNKTDDLKEKVVSTVDALRFAQQNDVPLFEINAKDNKAVQEILMVLTELMLKNKKSRQQQVKDEDVIKPSNEKSKKKGCF